MSRLGTFIVMLLSLVSFYSMAEAKFPISDPSIIRAPIQSWNNNKKVDFAGKGSVNGTDQGKIGYKSVDGDDDGRACDSGPCDPDTSYQLSETPNTNPPDDAIELTDGDINTVLPGGIYKYSEDVLQLSSGNKLIFSGPATLYVEKVDIDGGAIDVQSKDPSDFVLISTTDNVLSIKNAGDFYGHIFSKGEGLFTFTNLFGTISTGDNLKIDEGGVLNGELPSPPPPEDLTCRITGNNEDFVVEFDVVGSGNADYKEIVFEGGNESDTLWYNQQEQSGADYIFNEQRLASGQSYKLRIEVERGQGNDISRAHYYWVQGGTKVFQESKDADIKNGTITGTGAGLETLDCFNEDVEGPPDPEIPEVCEIFPGVAQTWVGSNKDKLEGKHTSLILDADFSGSDFYLGYGEIKQKDHESGLCNGELCFTDESLKLQSQPDFESLDFETPDIDDVTYSSGVTVLYPGTVYGKIKVEDEAEIHLLSSGNYYVEELKFEDDSSGKLYVKNGENVVFFTKKLELKDKSTAVVEHEGKPEDFFIIAPRLEDKGKDPEKGEVKLKSDASYSLNALILASKKVELKESVTLNGAVTVPELKLEDTAQLVKRIPDECETDPPPSNKTLIIVPETAQALTCDRIPVHFKVVGDNGTPISGYSASFTAVADPDNGSACWSTTQSGGTCTANSFTSQFVDGEKTLFLESTAVGNVDVSASVSADSLSDSAGPYRFVPFGFQFEPDPARAIAGKPVGVTIKAVADSGGSCEVIESYSGTKDLQLSSTNYIEPASGSKLVTASSTDITFSQGEGSMDLSYFDAGHVSVTVSDPDWSKEECGAECEDHQGDWTGLSGDAEIQARPYTLALCDITATSSGVLNPQGTSISGNGFVAAGDPFSTQIKPVVWATGDPESGVVDLTAKDYCSYETTPNFAKSDALPATMELSIPDDAPHSPGDGIPGVLSGNLVKAHVEGTNELYPFPGLSWNEVGSLLLTSQLDDDYYGMTVNPANIPVGRFYPAHLALIEDHYVYPNGQDEQETHTGFSYMNQGIGHDFIVEAQNRNNQPTLNYGLFAEALVVDIDYLVLDDDDNELTDRMDSKSWSDLTWTKIDWGKADINGVASNARLAPNTTDFMMQKVSVANTSGNYTTIPDGPYTDSNSEFGLEVSRIVDNVNFKSLSLDERGVKFSQQPDFRYGRMHLQDIGGNSDQEVDIPLKTEYWDSSERTFVTNSDDRRSVYLSIQRYCRQVIWSNEGGSDASLEGNGIVDEGLDSGLSATHTAHSSTHRSQVRLWLRQGITSPQRGESGIDCSNGGSYTDQPWLQYNWREQGDEDPSTVVTFGTFRGNDRIIFQGERGLFAN